MADESDSGRDPKTGLFKQGHSGNPQGRPVGARCKLQEAFLEDLQASWEQHGKNVIETVIADRPQDYLKVVANLLPRDVNLNLNENTDLTDAQLIERIRRLDAAIGPFLASSGEVRATNGSGQKTTH